jgi:hypothetical protein
MERPDDDTTEVRDRAAGSPRRTALVVAGATALFVVGFVLHATGIVGP